MTSKALNKGIIYSPTKFTLATSKIWYKRIHKYFTTMEERENQNLSYGNVK
jgi:hypothetical protein